MDNTRNQLPISYKTLGTLPTAKKYALNHLRIAKLNSFLTSAFSDAWLQTSQFVGTNGSLKVGHYLFKPGVATFTPTSPSTSKRLESLYSIKKRILNRAVEEGHATTSSRPNFSIIYQADTTSISQKATSKLLAACPVKKASFSFTLHEFKKAAPTAYAAMIVRNKIRELEKENKSLWAQACSELHSKYGDDTSLHIRKGTDLFTIAVFSNTHVDLKEEAAQAFKSKLAKTFACIKKVQSAKPSQDVKHTLYFVSYKV